MKNFFPESLGQKRGCALYTGAHYTWVVVIHIYINVFNYFIYAYALKV